MCKNDVMNHKKKNKSLIKTPSKKTNESCKYESHLKLKDFRYESH